MNRVPKAGSGDSTHAGKTGKRGRRPDKRKKTPRRAGGKRTVGRKPAPTASATRRPAKQLRGARAAKRAFPGLQERDGCGIMLVIAERADGEWEELTNVWEVGLALRDSGNRGAAGRATRVSPRTCRAFAAFGHAQRAKLMAKLLEGPATYRALQRVTKLKAGPLYHHINQLRLAGLILPKQRDVYELTRGGRNILLSAMAVGPLIGDTRRRPLVCNPRP